MLYTLVSNTSSITLGRFFYILKLGFIPISYSNIYGVPRVFNYYYIAPALIAFRYIYTIFNYLSNYYRLYFVLIFLFSFKRINYVV